ncbi:MAG: phosphate ABC transporter substrate-binding protein [Halochromatium sp.]|nr:phosphate ABC transporter substrate-binding protein [Halochromatium sp.]
MPMQDRKGLLLLLFVLLMSQSAVVAEDSLVVVMGSDSDVERLTREQVVHIFLGRFRRLPNGLTATPIDRPQDQSLMTDFYQLLVGKSPAEIRSYWSRLIFSGKTAPPRQAGSGQEVVRWLAETPGAIAYMRPDECPPQLRVVLRLGP